MKEVEFKELKGSKDVSSKDANHKEAAFKELPLFTRDLHAKDAKAKEAKPSLSQPAQLAKNLETKLMSEEASQKAIQMSQISLSLDTYDDIFSDFDPRPYSQRALSDDFLFEAKKASRDKASGTIQLSFLVPKHHRRPSVEAMIKKRLREHFRKHHGMLESEMRSIVMQGVNFLVFGFFFMLITTLVLVKNADPTFIWTFITVLLEPAGWFLVWEGLNLIVFKSKSDKANIEFYAKMAKCDIIFISY